MKKTILMTLAAVGIMTTSAFSIDCYFGCTKSRCKGERSIWNQCFKECWRSNDNKITHCKEGAAESENISSEQKWIMDYFNGGSEKFPHHSN